MKEFYLETMLLHLSSRSRYPKIEPDVGFPRIKDSNSLQSCLRVKLVDIGEDRFGSCANLNVDSRHFHLSANPD